MKQDETKLVLRTINRRYDMGFVSIEYFIDFIHTLIGDYIEWLEDVKMVQGTDDNLLSLLFSELLYKLGWSGVDVAENHRKQTFFDEQLSNRYIECAAPEKEFVSEKTFKKVILAFTIISVKLDEKKYISGKESYRNC